MQFSPYREPHSGPQRPSLFIDHHTSNHGLTLDSLIIAPRTPSLFPINARPSPLGLLSSLEIERQLSGSGSVQEHQHLRWSTQEGGLTHLRPRNRLS